MPGFLKRVLMMYMSQKRSTIIRHCPLQERWATFRKMSSCTWS